MKKLFEECRYFWDLIDVFDIVSFEIAYLLCNGRCSIQDDKDYL